MGGVVCGAVRCGLYAIGCGFLADWALFRIRAVPVWREGLARCRVRRCLWWCLCRLFSGGGGAVSWRRALWTEALSAGRCPEKCPHRFSLAGKRLPLSPRNGRPRGRSTGDSSGSCRRRKWCGAHERAGPGRAARCGWPPSSSPCGAGRRRREGRAPGECSCGWIGGRPERRGRGRGRSSCRVFRVAAGLFLQSVYTF